MGQDVDDVILVGHSIAGSVASALADRIPEALRHLVYLDAQLLLSGQSPASAAPSATISPAHCRNEQGPVIPPPSPEVLGVTDPDTPKHERPVDQNACGRLVRP